jgi:hypothetical protein
LAVGPASEDGVVLSLAAAVDGWLGASAGVDETDGIGGGGTAATAPVAPASGLGVEGIGGVELDALVLASALDDGCTSAEGAMLVPAEPCVFASTPEVAADERDADARVERLEVLVLALLFDAVFAVGVVFTGGAMSAVGVDSVAALRLGACEVATLLSASVAAVLATGGAESLVAGPRASATTACRVAGDAVFGVSLRLWLSTSAPPITVAVMTPNAIPKWFMEPPGSVHFVDAGWARSRPVKLRLGTENPTPLTRR